MPDTPCRSHVHCFPTEGQCGGCSTPHGIWEQRQCGGGASTANVSWPQPKRMETSDKQPPQQQIQPSRGRAAAQLSSLLALHGALGHPVGHQCCCAVDGAVLLGFRLQQLDDICLLGCVL